MGAQFEFLTYGSKETILEPSLKRLLNIIFMQVAPMVSD